MEKFKTFWGKSSKWESISCCNHKAYLKLRLFMEGCGVREKCILTTHFGPRRLKSSWFSLLDSTLEGWLAGLGFLCTDILLHLFLYPGLVFTRPQMHIQLPCQLFMTNLCLCSILILKRGHFCIMTYIDSMTDHTVQWLDLVVLSGSPGEV